MLIVLLLLIPLAYWASPLSFVPVPWPDDSAFFLPGIEWISWPSLYRMHAQAPFVPSYDSANFNTMPLMPLLLGLGNLMGIDTSHGIRLFGMLALGAWAAGLVIWLRRRRAHPAWVALVPLAGVLSPIARWGAMVVRPEIYQGLLWLLILMELSGFFRKASRWRLPALLALAAGLHFEAIVWVLPVAAALLVRTGGARKAVAALWDVGWRTSALLSPWLLYVGTHWADFRTQMEVQFGRLDEGGHPYVTSMHSFFHSLFLHGGSPVSFPKFFNLGKGLVWAAWLAAFLGNLASLRDRRNPETPARVAAALALGTTMYLWLTKPETWFITMIHLALWPAVALLIPRATSHVRWPRVRLAAWAGLVTLIVLQLGTAVFQWRGLQGYSWTRYSAWVDCIDRTLGARTRVWQPTTPDVLVELAGRRPDRDYTRAVDFPGTEALVERHARSREAIIHTTTTQTPEERNIEYSGKLRERDRYYLLEYPWLHARQYTAIALGKGWEVEICQNGPFWAAISINTLKP